LNQEIEELCFGKRKNVGGRRKIRRGLFEALDAAGGELGAAG